MIVLFGIGGEELLALGAANWVFTTQVLLAQAQPAEGFCIEDPKHRYMNQI